MLDVDLRRTSRHAVLVLVGDVDRRLVGTLRFVVRLIGGDAVAVHVADDPERTTRLAEDWMDLGVRWLPLRICDATDGDLVATIRSTVEDAARVGRVTVVVPEVEHERRWHGLLHRRTARRIVRSLQEVPGVATVVVPFWAP